MVYNQWHNDYRFWESSYNDNGDLFFDFHELYLAHFDSWRAEFGYPPITIWNPASAIPVGVEINHANRGGAYIARSLPTWFSDYPDQPGPPVVVVNGPQTRPISFLPIPPGGGPLPCETADAPGTPWPTTQDELIDFPADQELLGCALTSPYHNDRHVAIGGHMRLPSDAPRDPIFWRYHQFIETVSDERDGLTPPRVTYQYPFRLYPYLTELPMMSTQERGNGSTIEVPAISVYFSKNISGVEAQDFTVNGSPAMELSGQGSGPYIFSGFRFPELGSINVTLASGNISDQVGNRFEGESWKYILLDPTADVDRDGANDGLEVNSFRTNPTLPDSDGDGIPDGFEVSNPCLNPLLSDEHIMDMAGNITDEKPIDSDLDNSSNIEEFRLKTNPCEPSQ